MCFVVQIAGCPKAQVWQGFHSSVSAIDTLDEFVSLFFDWKGMKIIGIVLSARMEDGVLSAAS